MYLLDTNICIALKQEHPAAIDQFSRKWPQCYISTFVLAELYRGAYDSRRVAEQLTQLEQMLNLLTVIPFDQLAAEEFGKICAELRQIGKPTQKMDALIAATARSRGDILVTHNTKDFENIPHLQIEDWLIS